MSVLKVVATIDTPISHHGAARPEVKNSAVLDPARRASKTAGTNETTIDSDDDDPVERLEFHGQSVGAGPERGEKAKAGRVATGLQAGDGVRTRDPQLGKLMLYQLSYTRK